MTLSENKQIKELVFNVEVGSLTCIGIRLGLKQSAVIS